MRSMLCSLEDPKFGWDIQRRCRLHWQYRFHLCWFRKILGLWFNSFGFRCLFQELLARIDCVADRLYGGDAISKYEMEVESMNTMGV